MANVKSIVAAHLSQRQRNINQQAERTDLLGEDRLLCNIIRVGGVIDVTGRPGFVWCQEYSPSEDTSPFHAFNDKVQAREGLNVWIGPGLGGRREVLDWNNSTIINTSDYDAQKYQPKHASDHAWPDAKPGPDALNVYPRSLTMLRAYPGEAGLLTVSVASLRYIKDGSLITFPGTNSLDISASQPASGLALFVGLYLDWDDNTVKIIAGATTSDSPAITPDSPTFPQSAIHSVMVRLDGDQTTVSEVDFVDARQVLAFSGPGAVQVSEIWESDFGAVAMAADATGNITINSTGTLTIPSEIIHAGDTDTKIGFATDAIEITAGALSMLKLTETTQDLIEIGDTGGAGDVDINFNGGQMFLKGDDGSLGIGRTNPTAERIHIESSNATAYTGVVPSIANVQVAYANTADGSNVFSGFEFNNSGNSQNRLSYMGGISQSSGNRKMAFVIGTDDGTSRAERMRITGDGDVKIGITTVNTSAQLHVDQSDTAGAQPVILMDQADVDEPFMRMLGTAAAATLTQSIVAEADVATATRQGWLMVNVNDAGNQITDQDYFIPIYTLA